MKLSDKSKKKAKELIPRGLKAAMDSPHMVAHKIKIFKMGQGQAEPSGCDPNSSAYHPTIKFCPAFCSVVSITCSCRDLDQG